MSNLLKKMSLSKKVYAVSDCLDKSQLLCDGTIGIDPHIWFDIQLWKKIICFISQTLQAARPESAAYYQDNTTAYLAKF